jgi:hypothetical protein
MKKAFGSAVAATFCLVCLIADIVQHPAKDTPDINVMLTMGGGVLTWLLVSIGMFVWRFREWRDSRYITFIYWR